MRLIRLTTTDSSIFENDFSNEIVIEPNGQVALLNASLKLEEHEIIVDSANDLIQYQLTAGEGLRDVRLTHETYGAPSVYNASPNPDQEQLLLDITNQMNNSVGALLDDANYIPQDKTGFSQIETGLQWKAELDKQSNKVSINYKNISRKMRTGDFKVINVLRTGVGGTDADLYVGLHHYDPPTGLGTQPYGTQYSDVPVSEGGVQMLMRAHEFNGSDGALVPSLTPGLTGFYEQGFIIGLTNEKPSSSSSLTPDNLVYGVQLFQDTNADTDPLLALVAGGVPDYVSARASFVADGTDSAHFVNYNPPAPDTDTQNTYFGIVKALGVLYILSYTDNVGVTEERVIASFNLKSSSETLYPVMFYLSPGTQDVGDPNNNGSTIIGNLNGTMNFITLDPFKLNLPYTDSPPATEHDELGVAPPLQRLGRSNNRLIVNPALAEFLGFSPHYLPGPLPTSTFRNVLNQNAAGVPYTWLRYIAQKTFQALTLNDSYVIEILSQDLDSYDGLTTERRSILGIIPKNESGDGSLVYESSIVNKVSIRNASKIGVRNIRCRILNSELAPVAINGFSVITIGLYDSKNM